MYHSKLTFWISGIREEIVRQWEQLAPLPRFAHVFRTAAPGEAFPSGRNQIVIFHENAGLLPSKIREQVGKLGTCILCGESLASFSREELLCADEFWCGSFEAQDPIWRIRFEKLLERLKSQKDAWLTENYLDCTINMLPDLVWYKDREGIHLKVNDSFAEVTGKSKEECANKDHYYIWGVSKEDYADKPLDCVASENAVFEAGKTMVFDEDVVMAGKGTRKFRTWKTPVFEEDGTILGTVGIGRDMTQEYEYRKTIEDMAHRDAMTGLANRRYMYEYVRTKCAGKRLTVIAFDLDHFKHVNDTYGHQTGDAALLVLAEMLLRIFDDGLCIRMGGDEFMVVLPDAPSREDVEHRVQKFMDQLLAFYQMDPELEELSVSAGIAYGADMPLPLEELIRQSDAALYQAKQGGRACYRVYSLAMDLDCFV